MAGDKFQVQIGADPFELEVLAFERATSTQPGRLKARVDGQEIDCSFQPTGPGRLRLELGNRGLELLVVDDAGGRLVAGQGAVARIGLARTRRSGTAGRALPPEVSPPMPAVVVAVLVEPGQRVAAGDPAVVVSAMKMESSLKIPRNGTVREVRCKVGDKVSPGDVLVQVDPDAESEENA